MIKWIETQRKKKLSTNRSEDDILVEESENNWLKKLWYHTNKDFEKTCDTITKRNLKSTSNSKKMSSLKTKDSVCQK